MNKIGCIFTYKNHRCIVIGKKYLGTLAYYFAYDYDDKIIICEHVRKKEFMSQIDISASTRCDDSIAEANKIWKAMQYYSDTGQLIIRCTRKDEN